MGAPYAPRIIWLRASIANMAMNPAMSVATEIAITFARMTRLRRGVTENVRRIMRDPYSLAT